MMFFIKSVIFLSYVEAAQHKQNVIMRVVTRSSQIVNSFCPSTFHDRLFGYQNYKQDDAYASMLN